MAHSYAWQICAGCWKEASVLCHGDCSTGLLVLVTRQLACPRASDPGGSNRAVAVMFLLSSFGSHTLSLRPYPYGYTGQPYLVWEENTKGHEQQEPEIMGATQMAEKNSGMISATDPLSSQSS